MNQLNADFIAGISAGAVTTLVVHPLDLIKVRLQVDSSAASVRTRLRNAVFAGVEPHSSMTKETEASSSRIRHTAVLDQAKASLETISKAPKPQSLSSATKSQVVKSLYRGLPINLVGNTISWGMYFSLYHYLKNQLIPAYDQSRDDTPKLGGNKEILDNNSIAASVKSLFWQFTETADQSTMYLVCALVAGTSTSLLTNPLWVLKTRYLSTTKASTAPISSDGGSLIDRTRVNVKLVDIVRNEGIRTLWRGFLPGLFGVIQGSLQFAIYDEIKTRRLNAKKTLALSNNVPDNGRLGQLEYIFLSATSKIMATVTLYPYQLVRSRLQVGHRSEDGTTQNYKNARDVVIQTIKKEGGIRSLYKGLVPNLLRVVPSTTITFVVYENVQHWLKH